MHVLHLNRAATSQFLIEVLARAAKGLAGALSFGAKTIAVPAGRVRKEILIKLVAIRSDVRQQVMAKIANRHAGLSWFGFRMPRFALVGIGIVAIISASLLGQMGVEIPPTDLVVYLSRR